MEVFDAPAHYYPSGTLPLDDLAYWIAFSRVLGIGPKRFKLLLNFFAGDVAAAWQADAKALAQAGIDQKTIDRFLKQRTAIAPQRELERLERMRVTVLTLNDKAYPPLLKTLDTAPPVLYIAGKLTEADQFALGIVGTRNASQYGRQVTEQFASELAAHNVTIVSGLALGIDTIAHKAALPEIGHLVSLVPLPEFPNNCRLEPLFCLSPQFFTLRLWYGYSPLNDAKQSYYNGCNRGNESGRVIRELIILNPEAGFVAAGLVDLATLSLVPSLSSLPSASPALSPLKGDPKFRCMH